MQHCKTINDERGTVQITVTLIVFQFTPDINKQWFKYDVLCLHKPKGKKQFIYSENIATESEISLVKSELWQMLKP